MLTIKNLDYIMGAKIPNSSLKLAWVSELTTVSGEHVYILDFEDSMGSKTMKGEIKIYREPIKTQDWDVKSGNTVEGKLYKVSIYFNSYQHTNYEWFAYKSLRHMSAFLTGLYTHFNQDINDVMRMDNAKAV